MTATLCSACLHATAFCKDTPIGRRSFERTALKSAQAGGYFENGPPGYSVGSSETSVDDLSNNATFYYDVVHLTSLLHAVSIQELRLDDDLGNIIPYDIDDDDCNPPIAVDRHKIAKAGCQSVLAS
jgi:hypothetical protein